MVVGKYDEFYLTHISFLNPNHNYILHLLMAMLLGQVLQYLRINQSYQLHVNWLILPYPVIITNA